jgi:hypothetical protein
MATTNVSLGANAPVHMRGGLDHVENASSFSADGDHPAPISKEARRASEPASDPSTSVLRASRSNGKPATEAPSLVVRSRRDAAAVGRMRNSAQFRADVKRWTDHFYHVCQKDIDAELSELTLQQLKKRWPLVRESDIDWAGKHSEQKSSRGLALAQEFFVVGQEQVEELLDQIDAEAAA